MASQIILKIRKRKDNNSKVIYVPKDVDLKTGDYVSIKKIDDKDG